jgi:hypothetical protein
LDGRDAGLSAHRLVAIVLMVLYSLSVFGNKCLVFRKERFFVGQSFRDK